MPTAILIKHPARLQVARTPEEAARGQYGRIHSARVAFLLPGESTQSQVPCIAWRDVLGVCVGGLPLGCISAMSLPVSSSSVFVSFGEGKEKCQNKLERKEH